jgi:autotransporter-associated beta strand protein
MKTLKLSVVMMVLAMVCRTQAAITYMATNNGAWTTDTIWNPNGIPGSGDTAYITNGYSVTISGAAEQIGPLSGLYLGAALAGSVLKGSGTLVVSNGASLSSSVITVGSATSAATNGFLYIDGCAVSSIGNFALWSSASAMRQGSVVKVDNQGSLSVGNNTTLGGGSGFCQGSQLIITNGSSFTANNLGIIYGLTRSNLICVAGKVGSSRATWDSPGGHYLKLEGTFNGVIVDQGGLFKGCHVYLGGTNCYFAVTNGGLYNLGGNTTWLGYGASVGACVSVSGVDANGTPSVLNGGGGGNTVLYIGDNSTSWDSSLLIFNGGVVSNLSAGTSYYSLWVGRGAGSSNNYVSITSGGLLQQNRIAVGTNATTSVGNVLTNGPGGILQFTTATPALVVNNPNADPSLGNAFIITNGTVSFKGIAVSLTNNWAGSLAPSNNITWLGANTLRLDGANGTARDAYTFYNNNGPTNYSGLELFNSASLASNQAVTIGSSVPSQGGSLLVTNGAFSIRGVVTNYSPNVNLAAVTSLTASNGIVWMGGSAATTTAGTVTFDAITTNRLDSGTVAWNQSAATATQVVNGVILGGGVLQKGGPGVLILAGNNKYAGATTVSNGTLQVSGVITGSVAVASNATLNVSGSVTGAVSVAAGGFLLGPGARVGAVTNSGTISVVVTNATPAMINISGSLTLQAGAQLVLAGESTNYLANSSSSTLTIIHASGGLNGTIFTTANVPEGWRLSYDDVNGYVRLQPGYPGTMILFQ